MISTLLAAMTDHLLGTCSLCQGCWTSAPPSNRPTGLSAHLLHVKDSDNHLTYPLFVTIKALLGILQKQRNFFDK
jgi:hypothetical protein